MKNDETEAVYKETVKRLSRLLKKDSAATRAGLAELRHGIGKKPGEDPTLWGMLFDQLPEAMLGKYGKPSKEEWALYLALTLYALHQQGHDPFVTNINEGGISLGKAANKLVCRKGGTDDARENVSRRFNQIALAADIESLAYYLRTFIPLLREEDVKLDYAMLAQDIFKFQTEAGKNAVRLKWGQDYYSSEHNEEETV